MIDAFKIILQEHREFSKQVFMLAKSDLIKTYRGAALGWAWAVIKPLTTLFVFWFGFTVGLRSGKPINGYPYFLWLVAGFLPWFYMRDMIQGGASCIRIYRHLVTKIKFPISIIPTFTSLSHLVIHLLLLVVAVTGFWVMGFPPDIYYLQIPFYMILMFIFYEAWALFAGMLAAVSKDFLNLVNAMVQALFWVSGVIYNVDTITNPIVRTVLKFNPITVISGGYRKAFIDKIWFWEDRVELVGYTTTFILIFFLAIWAFKKLRKEIPDVL